MAGAKAKFKGSGTINGSGEYGFMISARNGDSKQNIQPDTFRIKIWDKLADSIIYDNQLGDDDMAEPSTVIGGGNVVLHE